MNLPNRFRVRRRPCGSIIEYKKGGGSEYFYTIIVDKEILDWKPAYSIGALTENLSDGFYKIIDQKFQEHRERLINS